MDYIEKKVFELRDYTRWVIMTISKIANYRTDIDNTIKETCLN